MSDVIGLRDGSKSVEDIVADWYSLQNLDSIHKAFSEWLRIDFWKIIKAGKKRKMGSKVGALEERLNYIIQFRHGVIHHMKLDTNLNKAGIDSVFATTVAVIDAFVDYLEESRGVPIRE